MSLIYLPISKITINEKKRWITKEINREGFICFDTETYQGKCKLICDSFERILYNPNFEQAIRFLFYKASESWLRAFYNIDFDVSAIFKLLIEQDYQYLYREKQDFTNSKEKVDINEFLDCFIHTVKVFYKDYKFYYIKGKMLIITKGHKTVYITDLFTMFKCSLSKASKQFLNDDKIDIIDGNKLNNNLNYWKANYDNIVKYCIKDCILTKELGNLLTKELIEIGLSVPRFLVSPASLAKQHFRLKCKITGLKHLPKNILDIAVCTYFGGRFEILSRGYFKKLYCYDINSAYPDTISRLPSLKYGKFKKVYSVRKNECIGFYKVYLEIPQDYISALVHKTKSGILVFPSGKHARWITWYEADLLRPYIKHLYYGYEYFKSPIEYYPFRDAVFDLYARKNEYKGVNDVWYLLIKLTLNSLYGCFIERHKKENGQILAGILFNPIYASIITARTRWKLLIDVPKKNWKNIKGFHTDSIITDKPVKLPISNELGAWSIEDSEAGVLIASGIYQIGNKVRRRGFADKTINWLELLRKYGNKRNIKFEQQHVLRMAETLKRFKSIEEVNKFIIQKKKMNPNTDKKRVWSSKFKNCADVLKRNIDSKTLHFNTIELRKLE